eukprot:Nk52_evm58s1992 gene=Nk52_evmTU58s1992
MKSFYFCILSAVLLVTFAQAKPHLSENNEWEISHLSPRAPLGLFSKDEYEEVPPTAPDISGAEESVEDLTKHSDEEDYGVHAGGDGPVKAEKKGFLAKITATLKYIYSFTFVFRLAFIGMLAANVYKASTF